MGPSLSAFVLAPCLPWAWLLQCKGLGLCVTPQPLFQRSGWSSCSLVLLWWQCLGPQHLTGCSWALCPPIQSLARSIWATWWMMPPFPLLSITFFSVELKRTPKRTQICYKASGGGHWKGLPLFLLTADRKSFILRYNRWFQPMVQTNQRSSSLLRHAPEDLYRPRFLNWGPSVRHQYHMGKCFEIVWPRPWFVSIESASMGASSLEKVIRGCWHTS